MSDAGNARIRLNGESRPLACSNVSELMQALGYAAESPGLAVAVNRAVVPRARWREHGLRDGDEVDIVGAVQGG